MARDQRSQGIIPRWSWTRILFSSGWKHGPLRWCCHRVLATLGIYFAANFFIQLYRKPTELMGFWSQGQAKTPTQTWKAYGDDFLQHHSSRVPASFLAAVAQLESSGNPWATPPWVWRWSELGQSWFGIYAPMSSAAGLYQFLDETFARVERREGRFLASRILATDAIELASRDFHWALDQMFSGNHRRFVNARHFVERFKALHHLCGFGVARAWAEPRLRQISQLGLQRLQRMENVDFGNEPRRCGSHDTELYFSKLLHFRKQFDAIIDNGRPRLLAPDVSQRTDPLSSRPDAQASGVR